MSTYPPVVELMPHDAPMILVDQLIEHHAEWVVCAVTITPEMAFVVDGQVATFVMLECMAQTIAVFAGYEARLDGDPARLGFLLGCRKMRCYRPYLSVGTTLSIHVERVWGDASLGKFECTATLADGTAVATASLSVVQPASDEAAAALLASPAPNKES